MKFMQYFKKPLRLSIFAAILSFFTLLVYHIPFFRYVIRNTEGGFNSVLIVGSLILLMFALNYLFYYLLLYLCRLFGKVIIALLFLINALSLYFINYFDALLTKQMLGNVFNTRYSEASGFFSGALVWYICLFGIIPMIYVFLQKVDYGKWKRFLINTGSAVGISLILALVNMANWPWIDSNSSTLGALLLPWSYISNSIRYWNDQRDRNREEISLPDAKILSDGQKDVCVLVIGESARRANFSLYGYDRPTNPLLLNDSVVALRATSAATYTTAGVKAILDHKETNDLYEILPNYLNRAGVDVTWRTSNWGEPPVHIDKYLTVDDLEKLYPDADRRYDSILFEGLEDVIIKSDKDKILIIIHSSTSHGPNYNQKYPEEFEYFKPVCTTVEMSKAKPQDLMNSYDNTIRYTDRLLHDLIETLKQIPDHRSCMIYVSDHGESLGEGNLYMHGVPMAMAPKVQTEIPFIVWTSDDSLTIDPSKDVTQYHVFHSVLRFLGIDSPVYNPSFDIFSPE